MSKSESTMGRQVVRVVVDSEMGEFYDWVSKLNSRVRNRELLHLARVGFCVGQGKASLVLSANVAAPVLSVDSAQVSDTDKSSLNSIAFLRQQAENFDEIFGDMPLGPPDEFH